MNLIIPSTRNAPWIQARVSALVTLLLLLWTAYPHAAENNRAYPGKLGIAKAANLSAPEREVEARFAAYLEAHTDAAISRYIATYGKEINTDNSRELSADYAPGGLDAQDVATIAARLRWSDAVYGPANAFSKELYRRALIRGMPTGLEKRVVFTAGGAGVGKSTAIRKLASVAELVEQAEILFDTTLSTETTALLRIQQALDAGRRVSIVLIYRDPIVSLNSGVLPRAKSTGRVMYLDGFIRTHLEALDTLLKISDLYKDDDRVSITVIDNRLGVEYAVVADREFVVAMAQRYSRETLKAEIAQALQTAYEKGRQGDPDGIPEEIFRAFKVSP